MNHDNKIKHPTCPHSRVVIKALEQIRIIEKYSNYVWADMQGHGFIPNVSNCDPQFFDDFQIISDNLKKMERLRKKIRKKCEILNTTEEQIVHFHALQNMRHGTSF